MFGLNISGGPLTTESPPVAANPGYHQEPQTVRGPTQKARLNDAPLQWQQRLGTPNDPIDVR